MRERVYGEEMIEAVAGDCGKSISVLGEWRWGVP